jgi:hypothetical protein
MNSLESLPYSKGVITRQISAENPTGEKGEACKRVPDPTDPDLVHSGAASDLGKGWKVRPFIKVKAGETVVLADIEGPGCINQFFITSDYPNLSELVLRFYWDEEAVPSVEAPLGAFFCIGHDTAPHLVSSHPVSVAPYRGCNSYWQMPFRKHARITITHEGAKDANVVAYRVLYKLHEISPDAAYFHSQYRRTLTTREHPEHVILDQVKGQGLYVGTYLAWNTLSTGWWGEGEVKFYIDGDTEFPTMADNGTEDYFGGAWNFGSFNPNKPDDVEQEFNTPYLGMPLAKTSNPKGPRKFSMYRWHILDSIGFQSDLKVTVQTLGWWPNGKYQPLTEDVASVAYWYQTEPHQAFPAFPSIEQRWDR